MCIRVSVPLRGLCFLIAMVEFDDMENYLIEVSVPLRGL